MKNIVVALILSVVLSACTTSSIDIPDRPTSFTFEASKLKTKEAIVSSFTSRNFQIVSDSDFQMVMDQQQHSPGAVFSHGSQFNGIPNGRVLIVLTGDNPTEIRTRTQIITNPGSGFEIVKDYNDKTFKNRIYLGMEEAKTLIN